MYLNSSPVLATALGPYLRLQRLVQRVYYITLLNPWSWLTRYGQDLRYNYKTRHNRYLVCLFVCLSKRLNHFLCQLTWPQDRYIDRRWKILPRKNVKIYSFWKCTNLKRKIRENLRTIKNGKCQITVKSLNARRSPESLVSIVCTKPVRIELRNELKIFLSAEWRKLSEPN